MIVISLLVACLVCCASVYVFEREEWERENRERDCNKW